MRSYPFWWLTATILAPAIALADCPPQSRCITEQTARTCQACLAARKDVVAPLPVPCTPVVRTVTRVERLPGERVVERKTDWTVTVVAVVVGFVGGAAAAWGMAR